VTGRHVFDTVASQEIYRGHVIALRADEVAMPGGNVQRREVVEHYGAVAVAAVDDADRIVLVHQYRHPLGRRLWELPAGLLDVPDEPPAATAARELVEEAGVTAERWEVLVDVAASPGFTDEVVRVFLATGLTSVDRPAATDDEEADLEVHRIEVAEAVRMVLAGEIVNAASVGGILALHAVRSGAAQPRSAAAPWQDRPTRFAARR
jgi:ADP-ribose pyrophosphatase